MSDIQQGQKPVRPRRGLSRFLPWVIVLIGLVAALYVIAGRFIKPAGDSGPKPAVGSGLGALAHGDMASLTAASAGQLEPDTVFVDAGDHPMHLSDLKGRILVVNLWATWCGPCIKEMPSLAKLQAAYPGKILVAPISMDKAADRDKARAFIADHAPLPFYQDEKSAMAFAISPPAEGFPTTVFYDAAGHERGRVAMDADWSSADAHAVIDALLKGG